MEQTTLAIFVHRTPTARRDNEGWQKGAHALVLRAMLTFSDLWPLILGLVQFAAMAGAAVHVMLTKSDERSAAGCTVKLDKAGIGESACLTEASAPTPRRASL